MIFGRHDLDRSPQLASYEMGAAILSLLSQNDGLVCFVVGMRRMLWAMKVFLSLACLM